MDKIRDFLKQKTFSVLFSGGKDSSSWAQFVKRRWLKEAKNTSIIDYL